MKMRTDRFRVIYETLVTLSERRLTGFIEEADVALMRRYYHPRYEATGDALNKTQINYVSSRGDKSKLNDPLGMQVALALAGETMLAIPMPKRKLTKAHLPKEFDGVEGDKNCAGRAQIMSTLGPLFDMGSENKLEFEDVSAEEAELAAPVPAAEEAIAASRRQVAMLGNRPFLTGPRLFAERVSLLIASGTESASAGNLTQHLALSVATASEGFSGAAVAETISLSVAAASESPSDATLVERLSLSIAISSESYSGAHEEEILALGVANGSESASRAVLATRRVAGGAGRGRRASGHALFRTQPSPAVALTIRSQTETASAAHLSASTPTPLAPPRVRLTVASFAQSTTVARVRHGVSLQVKSTTTADAGMTFAMDEWSPDRDDADLEELLCLVAAAHDAGAF